ncbi:MAG TPA: transcription antitermination factor NusB, partial [Kofleriaceae bacterium]|nr:transcription antitermination factor NusB [Kofleriaceae bacterium]
MSGGRGQPSARAVAHRVLARTDKGAYATLALDSELSRTALSDADRRLATELVYGTLRHRLRLDRALAAYAPRGIAKLSPALT